MDPDKTSAMTQFAMQVPKLVSHLLIAAGAPAPNFTLPKTKPAAA